MTDYTKKASELMAGIWSCKPEELENSDGPDVQLIAKALKEAVAEELRDLARELNESDSPVVGIVARQVRLRAERLEST